MNFSCFQFLSDLKPGKLIPLVLPETEQKQFQHLLKELKNVKNGCDAIDTGPVLPTKKLVLDITLRSNFSVSPVYKYMS